MEEITLDMMIESAKELNERGKKVIAIEMGSKDYERMFPDSMNIPYLEDGEPRCSVPIVYNILLNKGNIIYHTIE